MDRQIRAQLYEQLPGGNGPKTSARALKLAGARITDILDLEAATLSCPHSLDRCYLRPAHQPRAGTYSELDRFNAKTPFGWYQCRVGR